VSVVNVPESSTPVDDLPLPILAGIEYHGVHKESHRQLTVLARFFSDHMARSHQGRTPDQVAEAGSA
jgi:hypothetical protein